MIGDSMKKLIIGILSILIITSIIFLFLNNKPLQQENNQVEETFSSEYIEVIPDNAKEYIDNMDNKILKTQDEINTLNEDIFKKSNSMYDLDSIKSMKKDEILKLINAYKLPTLPKYNGTTPITNNDTKVVSNNRNLDNVKDINVIKGVIVERANLRSFPSDIHFYETNTLNNFDMLQETELLVGTNVLILHESLDKVWNFVISPTYAGWVKKDNIAILNDKNEALFNSKDFIIVTDSKVTINNKVLDMSVKLPYLETNQDGYLIALPKKDKDGYLDYDKVTISRDKAHIGYLEYTKRNVIIQAFKYENTPYSWSGLDNNVDCSSYVSNIYRTFGIYFPRNTKEQNKSIGTITNLEGKSNQDKLKLIENTEPSLLFQSGHVMLYLGKVNDKHYIIHASGDIKNLKVLVTILDNSTHLSKIYQVNEVM